MGGPNWYNGRSRCFAVGFDSPDWIVPTGTVIFSLLALGSGFVLSFIEGFRTVAFNQHFFDDLYHETQREGVQ